MGIRSHSILRRFDRRAATRAALVLVGLGLPLAGMAAPAAVAAGVPVVTVGPAGGSSALLLEGALQARRQATVAAQVGGSVLALNVRAGDRVKAGQALARLDGRDAQAGLQRSEAALAQAEAEARNAELQWQRTRELQAKGFVSAAALDVAETQAKAAQGGVRQAAAGRAQAALASGFTVVTAPFDGVVLATHLDAGELATPGRAIATVAAPGALRAVVQVAASQSPRVRGAVRVEVELADGRRLVPAGRTELSLADPVAQTVEWRFDLPADTPDIVPGQRVRVRFDGAPSPAAVPSAGVQVPAAALLRRGELTAVYVAQGDAFVLRAVRVVPGAEAAPVTVLGGLKAGERVAANAVQAGLRGARPAN